MSDDKSADATPKPAEQDGTSPTPKVWSDDEVRKIIEDRDKAKGKLRKIDEDAQKAAETKAIDEGKLKEVLDAQKKELEDLRKLKESYDAEQKSIRDAALAKLSDEDKEIGNELSTPKLLAYVEKATKQPAPFDGKGKPKDTANPSKALPGESFEQYQKRLANHKWGAS